MIIYNHSLNTQDSRFNAVLYQQPQTEARAIMRSIMYHYCQKNWITKTFLGHTCGHDVYCVVKACRYCSRWNYLYQDWFWERWRNRYHIWRNRYHIDIMQQNTYIRICSKPALYSYYIILLTILECTFNSLRTVDRFTYTRCNHFLLYADIIL